MSSDPTNIAVPTHQALTGDMMLGLKPSAPKSRSYRYNISPSNKSVFVPLDTLSIDVPTSRAGTWLDPQQSYLKFCVQVSSTAAASAYAGVPGTNTTGIYFDNSAYSLFQRLDVYHQSNLIETVGEYGQLFNLLLDTSLTQSDKAGLSAMIGTNPFLTTSSGGATYAQYGGPTQTQTPGDRSGLSIASTTTIG
jgi:hypothetical protein